MAFDFAMAAQVGHCGRQVVAFVGDGGFSMLMDECANCVMYKLRIELVIIRNNSLGMIMWEQMVIQRRVLRRRRQAVRYES